MEALSSSRGNGRSASGVTPGASRRFVAATEQLDSGTRVVSVMGDVDLAAAPALEQTLLVAADGQTGEVIVDLTACSFFDSRGLRSLLASRTRLESSNRSLALVVSRPHVLKVFTITGFDELVQIYPTLGAAVDGEGDGRR